MSEGLFSRWARRKRAVRQEERDRAAPPSVAATAPPDPRSADDAPPPSDSATDDEGLAEAIARLPRIEDLTAETELAPFLRAGIPAALRKAALRRMWSVDPAIRNFVSEARDYAYDWNTPGGVPGTGPMLPTDDIKAMVERIMTGHAPRPAEPTPEASAPDAEETPPDAPTVEATEEELEVAALEFAPAVHVVEEGHHPPDIIASPFQSPASVSSLRRHGGALPR